MIFSKQHVVFFCRSNIAFSPCISFAPIWCIHINTTTAWKKYHFILLQRLAFHMIDNLSTAVHTFARCILTSLSVDEIMLPRYVNSTTNFKGSSHQKEKTASCFKHTNSPLFVFMLRPFPPASCSKLCRRDFA